MVFSLSDGSIFPTANIARSSGQSYTIVHNECRDIESAILYAIDAGLYNVYVTGTLMTNPDLSSFNNISAINNSTYVITLNSHGLVNGDEVQFQTTGTLPTPLSALSTYFVTVVDANNFKISANYINYTLGSFVAITTQGTGTHSVRKLLPSQKYYQSWQGSRDDRGQILQMNNVINYFTNLGYDCTRQLNTATSNTFVWSIRW